MIPHGDDPMVITLQIFKWDVKRVLIDLGSSAEILYYETIERMGLDYEQLKPFKGTLAGFTGEQVYVCGYITLKTTFGVFFLAKTTRKSPENVITTVCAYKRERRKQRAKRDILLT